MFSTMLTNMEQYVTNHTYLSLHHEDSFSTQAVDNTEDVHLVFLANQLQTVVQNDEGS